MRLSTSDRPSPRRPVRSSAVAQRARQDITERKVPLATAAPFALFFCSGQPFGHLLTNLSIL